MNDTSTITAPLLKPCFAGCLQFDVKTGAIDANINAVEKGLDRLSLQHPGIVVLPELWATGFAYDRLDEMAGKTPEILNRLQKLAGQYRVVIVGSLPEAVDCEEGRHFYNTLSITDQTGVLGTYRKQYLFAPMREDRYFSVGDSPAAAATPIGRVASLVCFDLRFPELVRNQARDGAGLLVISAQWPAARRDHWQTLVRARAIENQLFVLACNRCGTTGDTEFGGNSMIVAPDGTVLSSAGDGVEEPSVRIDPGLLGQVRSRFTSVGKTPHSFYDSTKVIEEEALGEKLSRSQGIGRTIVFTNGCFDILHTGHVTYLEQARKKGDCLVVGLNSDASIKSIKGPDRPINSEESRARILAALGCVDFVVLFDEDTPHRLITTLMPDVLVKGADWEIENIVGAKEVLAAGGRVETIAFVENHSTTSLIEKIRE